MNKRYNEQDPAPQYDPETARIRRALRAQKARRRKKMRSRRLFLLGMALILLFVLVPNLWGRAERLLYPRKYEALVDQWAETYGLDPLLVDAFIRTESGYDPHPTSTVEARGLMPSCFMVVNDGSYAAGCVVSCSAEAGAAVEVGSVITVYIAADPSVAITTEPPAASDSGSGESASSSEETAPDDTVHDTD